MLGVLVLGFLGADMKKKSVEDNIRDKLDTLNKDELIDLIALLYNKHKHLIIMDIVEAIDKKILRLKLHSERGVVSYKIMDRVHRAIENSPLLVLYPDIIEAAYILNEDHGGGNVAAIASYALAFENHKDMNIKRDFYFKNTGEIKYKCRSQIMAVLKAAGFFRTSTTIGSGDLKNRNVYRPAKWLRGAGVKTLINLFQENYGRYLEERERREKGEVQS